MKDNTLSSKKDKIPKHGIQSLLQDPDLDLKSYNDKDSLIDDISEIKDASKSISSLNKDIKDLDQTSEIKEDLIPNKIDKATSYHGVLDDLKNNTDFIKGTEDIVDSSDTIQAFSEGALARKTNAKITPSSLNKAVAGVKKSNAAIKNAVSRSNKQTYTKYGNDFMSNSKLAPSYGSKEDIALSAVKNRKRSDKRIISGTVNAISKFRSATDKIDRRLYGSGKNRPISSRVETWNSEADKVNNLEDFKNSDFSSKPFYKSTTDEKSYSKFTKDKETFTSFKDRINFGDRKNWIDDVSNNRDWIRSYMKEELLFRIYELKDKKIELDLQIKNTSKLFKAIFAEKPAEGDGRDDFVTYIYLNGQNDIALQAKEFNQTQTKVKKYLTQLQSEIATLIKSANVLLTALEKVDQVIAISLEIQLLPTIIYSLGYRGREYALAYLSDNKIVVNGVEPLEAITERGSFIQETSVSEVVSLDDITDYAETDHADINNSDNDLKTGSLAMVFEHLRNSSKAKFLTITFASITSDSNKIVVDKKNVGIPVTFASATAATNKIFAYAVYEVTSDFKFGSDVPSKSGDIVQIAMVENVIGGALENNSSVLFVLMGTSNQALQLPSIRIPTKSSQHASMLSVAELTEATDLYRDAFDTMIKGFGDFIYPIVGKASASTLINNTLFTWMNRTLALNYNLLGKSTSLYNFALFVETMLNTIDQSDVTLFNSSNIETLMERSPLARALAEDLKLVPKTGSDYTNLTLLFGAGVKTGQINGYLDPNRLKNRIREYLNSNINKTQGKQISMASFDESLKEKILANIQDQTKIALTSVDVEFYFDAYKDVMVNKFGRDVLITDQMDLKETASSGNKTVANAPSNVLITTNAVFKSDTVESFKVPYINILLAGTGQGYVFTVTNEAIASFSDIMSNATHQSYFDDSDTLDLITYNPSDLIDEIVSSISANTLDSDDLTGLFIFLTYLISFIKVYTEKYMDNTYALIFQMMMNASQRRDNNEIITLIKLFITDPHQSVMGDIKPIPLTHIEEIYDKQKVKAFKTAVIKENVLEYHSNYIKMIYPDDKFFLKQIENVQSAERVGKPGSTTGKVMKSISGSYQYYHIFNNDYTLPTVSLDIRRRFLYSLTKSPQLLLSSKFGGYALLSWTFNALRAFTTDNLENPFLLPVKLTRVNKLYLVRGTTTYYYNSDLQDDGYKSVKIHVRVKGYTQYFTKLNDASNTVNWQNNPSLLSSIRSKSSVIGLVDTLLENVYGLNNAKIYFQLNGDIATININLPDYVRFVNNSHLRNASSPIEKVQTGLYSEFKGKLSI